MAKLSLFMPTSEKDSTGRIVTGVFKLLRPIYALPNWDLFRHGIKRIKETSVEQVATLENISSYGRPLWYVYYSELKKDKLYSADYLVQFAINKLCCYQNIAEILKKPSDDSFKCFALALIGVRAVINLNPVSVYTTNLVADFMAICLLVDESRKLMFATYASEPILAEASAQLCNKEYAKEGLLRNAINALKDSITNGDVDQGKQGELTARIIILNAIDSAVSKLPPNRKIDKLAYLAPITVEEFLNEFVGKHVVDEIRSNRTDVSSNFYF